MNAAVKAYIADYEPASLLECSHSPWGELANFYKSRDLDFTTGTPARILAGGIHPAELAIVHDALEQLDVAQGRELLGYLRNALARRIWLLLPRNTHWTLGELIALGFKKDPTPPDPSLISYTYDLDTYNHKRSWNNSRFWANPENFHKYRW